MTAKEPNPSSSRDPGRPPLIYISYSRTDEAWVDKLLSWLKPLEGTGLIRVFYDRLVHGGEDWNQTLQSNLTEAALGIVLLSPDWLASEYGVKLELPVLSARHLVPILVRPCDWRAFPDIARRQILTANGKALSEVRRPKQEQAFRSLVNVIHSVLEIPSELQLSPEAQQIRALAAQLAGSRKDPSVVDAACLVYALLERGQRDPEPIKTPQFLWNAIPTSGRSRYPELRSKRFPLFPSGSSAAVVDSPDLRLFDDASVLSGNTLERGPIHARHLLAVMLAAPDSAALLSELDLDLPVFKHAFLEFVLKAFPEEPRDYWTSFLEQASEPDQPEMDEAGGARGIASFQSEDWKGRDLLNIRRDVNALAALVASWNVQPPLSIGLFGEWGSGKSFFMRQMRKRVEQLALAAQKSGKPQRECAYYKNIAQIEFNAWHYMEGDNLWACLVEHIFSNLGLPQDTTDAQIENRKRHILEQIGVKKALENQAAERRQELQIKKTEAENKAATARTELDAVATALRQEKSALWKRIEGQLSSEGQDILQSIPEAAKLRDAVATVQKFSQDAQTLGGRALLLWNLLRHDPRRRDIFYWMVGGSAAMFVLLRLAHLAAPEIKLLFRPAFQALVPILSALAATAGKFRPVLTKIGQVVSFFEKKNQEVTEAVAAAERAQQQQIAKLENEVRTLSQSIAVAEKEEQEHQDAIVALEKELASTDANRLLAEFIKSRADADDYRKHLGIVALVRRDFERLSGFFRSQREAEDKGEERVDDNTVNRIILYVDDLDRCPPQTVVNVLQAIHLLLAFPIFVVVVAVDSRWVSRSLERCYDWLVPGTPKVPIPRSDITGPERPRFSPGATAHDYLEKIFQIPFWLAPMRPTDCQSMIRGLAQAASARQISLRDSIARSKEQQTAAKMQAAVAGAADGTPTSQTARDASSAPPPESQLASPPPPPGQIPPLTGDHGTAAGGTEEPETIDLAPRQLDVEEPELKMIDQLASLIGRSPRVAKRFLNCYRLLKVRMDETELQQFLAGRYRDVMEVLAIVVGAPSIACEVLNAIAGDGSRRDNKGLLERLKESLGEVALTTPEGAAIARLLDSCSAEHLESLRGVVPLVSRFSFETQSDSAVGTAKRLRKKTKTTPA